TTASRSGALPSWMYGGCCQSARNGVVRYIFVALRDAYTGSVPTSKGECRNGMLGLGPLSTSVNNGGLWHRAHPAAPLNSPSPRRCAASLKLSSGGGGVSRPS